MNLTLLLGGLPRCDTILCRYAEAIKGFIAMMDDED